jgi:hypothetical protein
MQRHRFVVVSVWMEYSGILGLDVLRSLQAKLDWTDNYMIVFHDRFPFVRTRCNRTAHRERVKLLRLHEKTGQASLSVVSVIPI